MAKKAYLVLEDGTVFEGEAFGAEGSTFGEVVFDTSMTGYQEMLTDPSFAGQLLTLTYPLVGNYGINVHDDESKQIQVRALVVREHCAVPSHYQSFETLDQYLSRQGIPGVSGIDTRAVTRRLRSAGVMMGVVTTDMEPEEALTALHSAPAYGDLRLADQVATQETYAVSLENPPADIHIVLFDFGVKRSIIRHLNRVGCRVTVVPINSTTDSIQALTPDGILLSPGPGDPAHLSDLEETIKTLLGKYPMMAICLGHQLVARALGGSTFKMKFGHHGGNHPVRDLVDGSFHITTQNHGYAVDPDSLPAGLEVSQLNLNDGTVEGLTHADYRLISIQYHAEGTPGPQDSNYLFDRFVELIRSAK